jgi:carboxymethylenebutenolidase
MRSGNVCLANMHTDNSLPNGLTADQQKLVDLWDEHIRNEFASKDAAGALHTMVADSYVNHVPVLTGGNGREQLHDFYANYFIPQMPADTEMVPVSRTVGADRLVDEMVIRFTHNIAMDWMLPGVAPTGKRVECALIVVVQFRDGQMLSERIYWDQASVLVQLGLLDASSLPVAGAETARKVLDPTLPSNQLMKRRRPS